MTNFIFSLKSSHKMETEFLNEKLIKIQIEEGFNQGNIRVFDKHTSRDFVMYQSGFIPPNVEGIKNTIKNIHIAFPDSSMVVDDMVTSDNKVRGHLNACGT
jgi:hypothetical protein